MNLSWIVPLQTQLTQEWHRFLPQGIAGTSLNALVERHHLGQFNQWHEEDLTRNTEQPFEVIAKAKWRIDRLNQERHNLVEAMDEFIAENLSRYSLDENMAHNSETPGSIIDRLSILCLKEYHMREQSQRIDADDSHRARCATKLARIVKQKTHLDRCLGELIYEVESGKRTYSLNYQFKMYNDPAYKTT